MAIARLDIRFNSDIKAKAEKASALLGVRSLTEYIVRLIDENSTKVIQQYESMTVSALHLYFCQKKQEIGVGAWVAGFPH